MGQKADDKDDIFPVQWIVNSASSQSELHPGSNVLDRDLHKPWLTHTPTDDAWLCLESCPPTAFNRVEVVNAGSALLEIHGLRDDVAGDAESDYELLLSAQQVMSVKDLMSKSNHNQAFIYDIDSTHKLASVAAQQRWRKIRVHCRQPFGTPEHRACIGLAYIDCTPCPCKSRSNNSTQFPNSKAKPAVLSTKRKVPSWLSSSEPTAADDLSEKKPRAKPRRNVVKSDAEEGSTCIDVVDLEQGGSSKLESQALKGKAVTLTMEHSAHEGRMADSSETGEERAVGRSSLKRPSSAAQDSEGKETKKAKVEKESPNRVDPAVFADDALSKIPTSESADNQVLCVGSKDGSEREFSKLLEGVVFTVSGIQNPERGQLRIKGLEMGAQYQPDWSADCTLLVCAVMNTPKFKQVQADGGSIVSKDWISECYKKRKLVDFGRFVMNKGRPWRLPDIEVKRKVNCGSVEEVRKWAQEDLTSITDWLLQQDTKPEPEELEFTAAQGILVCLEDVVKSLTKNQGLRSIIESWGFLPRAVKELAAIEEGYTETFTLTLQEAERLKGIYNDFLASVKKPTNVIDDQQKGDEEDEVDDDATEVMSDIDSQETVEYDSDETTVLDSETILECTHKLMQRFSRN